MRQTEPYMLHFGALNISKLKYYKLAEVFKR